MCCVANKSVRRPFAGSLGGHLGPSETPSAPIQSALLLLRRLYLLPLSRVPWIPSPPPGALLAEECGNCRPVFSGISLSLNMDGNRLEIFRGALEIRASFEKKKKALNSVWSFLLGETLSA